MLKLVLFAILFVGHVRAQTSNYCARSLCSKRMHIACQHSGLFSSACLSDRKILPIEPYIDFILTKHNEYRNTVAAGNLPGFLPATRMGTMQWDSELADLAALNVMQCEMEHDQCRNTDRFKWTGQNLSWYWSRPSETPKFAINEGMTDWFNEYTDASMTFINSYRSTKPTIGHFTPMVNDRSIRIGCAILQQTRDRGAQYFFACNYSQNNIRNRKIYNSGETASGCTTGTNTKYPALCSASEPIDPNVTY